MYGGCWDLYTVGDGGLSGTAGMVAAGTCRMENRYEFSILEINFHNVNIQLACEFLKTPVFVKGTMKPAL